MSEGKKMALRHGMTIQGQMYKNIETTIQDISQIEDPVERFEAQQATLEDFEQYSDNMLDALEVFYNWTIEDKAYEAMALSKNDVLSIFEAQGQMVANNIKKRDRRQEALRFTENAWKDSPRGMAWLEDHKEENRNFFNETRTLAKSTTSFTQAATRINAAIYKRLNITNRGNRTTKTVVPKNLINATRMMLKDEILDTEIDISENWLMRMGMRIGRHGVLELDNGNLCILMAPEGKHSDGDIEGGDETENGEGSTAIGQRPEPRWNAINNNDKEDDFDFASGKGKGLLNEFPKNAREQRERLFPGAAPPNTPEVEAMHTSLSEVDPHYQELGIDPKKIIGSKRYSIRNSSSDEDDSELEGGVTRRKKKRQRQLTNTEIEVILRKYEEPESGPATRVGEGSNTETAEEPTPDKDNSETEFESIDDLFRVAAPPNENPTGSVGEEKRDNQIVPKPKSEKKSEKKDALLENPEINCKCSRDVPVTGKMDCLRIGEKRERSLFKFLDQFATFTLVCDLHTKECAGRLELTIIPDLIELRGRINRITNNKERIGNMKKDSTTSAWWIPSARALNAEDLVTTYRHILVEKKKFSFQRPKLIKYLDNEFKIRIDENSWKKEGVAILPIFKWLEKHASLCKAMQEEFRMYRFHQQPAEKPQYNSIQKTQYYSIAQQFIRQDLVHYLCHVVMRDDKETRLIAYPYPCRYELDNEIIPVYHKLDIRVSESIKKKDVKNYIHSSVSIAIKGKGGLKQKLEKAAARETLIPGFHKNIEKWWSSKIKAGVREPDSPTQDMGLMYYDEEDLKRYGGWEERSIEPGEVLFRLPTIPHASEEREGDLSMVIYPKMVALQDDNETLEIPGIGTWSELSAWTASMKAPITTTGAFTDFPNLLPFQPSPSITLDEISPISDAILCRKSWNATEVINARHQLLNTNRIGDIVEDSQSRAISQATVAYSNLRIAEKIAWGEDSYYHLVDTSSESIDLFFSGTNLKLEEDEEREKENEPIRDDEV